MVNISASSLNSQCKCELAFALSKSDEGKKLRLENGIKFAMSFGTILHHACQSYDVDRFIHKCNVPKTVEEVRNRYHASWVHFFTDPKSVKKENISKEQQEMAEIITLPKLFEWLWEDNIKKQAELKYLIKSQQDKMIFQFSSKKPLSWYYEYGYKLLYDYIVNNPFDVYGTPVDFCVEKAYNIQYGSDMISGYVDERFVFDIEGKHKVFLKEIKTSATDYKPEDCQIDNQMGLYVFYEHIDSGTPIEDIYVVMHQLSNGVCTITQRTEENLDLLMRHVDERLKRQNEINEGTGMPLPSCGTNSYDHSRLMCDYKIICPVWKQFELQSTPIVLCGKGNKNV